MGSIQINDGSWKDAKNFYVKPGAVWTPAKRVWIRDGSGWVLAWENEVEEKFVYGNGQTYYGSGVDASGHKGTAKYTTSRGNAVLVQGGKSSNVLNARGHWYPAAGNVSGLPIEQALINRTITGFKINLDLSWSHTGRYNSDGVASRMGLWATWYELIPTTFNPPTMIYLGSIAWFPAASDYTNGYATVTAAQLGKDPPVQGNRYPSYRANIDMFPQLSATAKTNLTNGYIKGFVFQAYDHNNTDQTVNTRWYSGSNKPGLSYTTSGVLATGSSSAFTITVTHSG